ncbi:hypothetical protein COV20_05165 [Candidatus Woesearchaeota archaeon CG10_big_fil_rev_8_21_14_0_10_45_16]|nr:MAG: hypothetical protein COV20_05165 [Candidatus Woesearchaeota archaeon CG10_big_fil_rev_8_21_14_0_10_45_16]
MRFALLLVFFMLLPSVFSWPSITEIMYAPPSDSSNEWLEIFNPGNESYDLAHCLFEGKNLTGIVPASSYLVLARDPEAFVSSYGNDVPFQSASFGRGLSNSGDTVILGCPEFTETLSYDGSLANKNDLTLERNSRGEWKENIIAGGTPGRTNSIFNIAADFKGLKITEIMPDPSGDDTAERPFGEWVELYNEGDKPIYLGGLVLFDEDDSHELYITDVNTEKMELCPGCYTTVFRNGDSDFDLSRTEDTIRLFTGYPVSENALIDHLSYSQAVEGSSFSRFPEGWFRTLPTPSSANIYTAGCDWRLRIEQSNSIFKGDELAFTVVVERVAGISQNISVKGTLEDLFGKVIKEYQPWTDAAVVNHNSKDYSPNLPDGSYQLHFWLEDLACNDINLGNNDVKTLTAVNPQYQVTESSLEIENIYLGSDEEAEWGDQFTAKINIYKGDETRTAVNIWLEDDGEKVSKTTKINLYDKYKLYPLTVPIQLEPNCNNKLPDGSYDLVVEAFGLRQEEKIKVAGVDSEVCRDYLSYVKELEKDQVKQQKDEQFSITEMPLSTSPGSRLPLKVQILNDAPHTYTVWSYVYRGSRCYSCQDNSQEREQNARKVTLKEDEVGLVDFLLPLDTSLDEGDYNVKVKIIKDDQKTAKELTGTVAVEPLLEEKDTESGLDTAASPGFSADPLQASHRLDTPGIVSYESSSSKAFGLAAFFLVLGLGLLSAVLIWRL